MVAICDLNEYRSCTKPLGPLVAELFETLHALCNLLLVKPENLQQVCTEASLVCISPLVIINCYFIIIFFKVNLDRSVLHNFIQLRSDFRNQKSILKA